MKCRTLIVALFAQRGLFIYLTCRESRSSLEIDDWPFGHIDLNVVRKAPMVR